MSHNSALYDQLSTSMFYHCESTILFGCRVVTCLQAPQPELYLLPTVENNSSVCSQSLTLDTSSSSPDHQTYYPPTQTCNQPAGTKGPIKFPLIPQCSRQSPPTQSPEGGEEEVEEEGDEEQCFSSSEEEGGNEEEGLSSNNLNWAEQECCPRQIPHSAPQSVSQSEGKSKGTTCSIVYQYKRKKYFCSLA